MGNKNKQIISSLLGDSFFEDLQKFEIIKPQTETAVDHEEMATALQIVPRAVMGWLVKNLSDMKEGENKTLPLPFAKTEGATLSLKKLVNDVYSGDIIRNGKVANKFLYRTIPGIGLIILTTFELYEIDDLEKTPEQRGVDLDIDKKIKEIVEEKLNLRRMIEQVVDKKMSEKDAIESLVLAKLTSQLKPIEIKKIPQVKEGEKRPLKLKEFLEKINRKFSLKMEKSECVKCPDCGQTILLMGKFSGCVCLGDDRNKKVSLTKSEQGFDIVFGKNWDEENIEMVLEALRKG